MLTNHKILIIIVAAASMVACAGGNPQATAAADSARLAAAIANPARPADDVARDQARQPQAVLEFAGLGEGDAFLDMFAGGGYYAELAAYVVGPRGTVVAYNNTGYSMVAKSAIEVRYAGGRLDQVQQLVSENNALELPENSFDVALFGLSYHDIYHLDGERGWVRIDRPKLLAEVYGSLKPGGVVVVIDHVAADGMPDKESGALHRIDPEAIRADFLAAGFRSAGELDVLRNPSDNYSLIAMAPPVRGKTDRVVLRFQKP